MFGFANQDFASWWLAARALLDGRDPYLTVTSAFGAGFVYPLPAALATMPLALIPPSIAAPLFSGLSCAALAYVVSRRSWWPLVMFLSGSMAASVAQAQWSPLLTVGLIVPGLAWIGVLKPNIGLGMLAYRPSVRTLLLMLGVAGASLLVLPSWPREWLAVAAASPAHFAPWRTFGGILILGSLARWRRPEARLLAVLAVLPSSPMVYEGLPLFVVPQSRGEMALLVLLSDVMSLVMANFSAATETAAYMRLARPAMVWLMYLPCTVMVVRRANEGALPAWLERKIASWPSWMRGRAPQEADSVMMPSAAAGTQ